MATSTWRNDLLNASLDGVQFFYKEVSNRVGRRKVRHMFPGRDEPYMEDMGREPWSGRIQAFVIGETYMSERDTLRDMLNEDRTFTFVHPYWGDMRVQLLEPAEFIERDDQGRYCEISMALGEFGAFEPRTALNTKTAIKLAGAATLDAVSKKTRFSLLKAIGAVVASVTRGINAVSSTMRKVNGKIAAQMHLIDNLSAALDELDNQIDTLKNTPTALMNKLGLLLDSLMQLISGAPKSVPKPRTIELEPNPLAVLMEAFRDITSFTHDQTVIPTPTPQSDLEQTALDDLEYSMHAAGFAATANALADLEFESANDAAAVMAELATFADTLIAVEGVDDEIVDSLSAVKTELVRHLTLAVQQLPQLATYTPNRTAPALVIAYDVHADARRDLEIVARNKIVHPGFVAGGSPLEILADVT